MLNNNKNSITSASFTAPIGTLALILVSYQDGGSQSCDSATANTSTLTSISSSAVQQAVWWTGNGDYGMCAFMAQGGGSAGTVKVTFSGNTQNADIQVIDISGDSSATFGLSGTNSGSGTSPAVTLSGVTSGSSEIFFGDTANGTSTMPTWGIAPSGFTQAGITQMPTTDQGNEAFSANVYFGPSASTVIGSLGGSNPNLGTIGIEIKP